MSKNAVFLFGAIVLASLQSFASPVCNDPKAMTEAVQATVDCVNSLNSRFQGQTLKISPAQLLMNINGTAAGDAEVLNPWGQISNPKGGRPLVLFRAQLICSPSSGKFELLSCAAGPYFNN